MDKKKQIIKIIEDGIYLDVSSDLVADRILNLFSVGKQSELLRCNLKNCFRKAEKHKDGYNYCDKHRPKA